MDTTMNIQHYNLSPSTTSTLTFLFISSSTTFIFLLITSLIRSIRSPTSKLPPGPLKLPIIGNLHNLIGSLPHRRLRSLSEKHGPLMHLQLGQVSAIVVSSSRAAREVMQTHDLSFAFRPRLLAVEILAYRDGNIAVAPHGKYWKQMKRIFVTELLGPKKVRTFSRIREEETRSLVETLAAHHSSARAPVDLTAWVYELMASITFRAAFGRRCRDEAELVSLVREASELAGGFGLADLFPSWKCLEGMSLVRAKLEKIHEKSDKIIQTIVDEHREKASAGHVVEDQEDLVDVLLRLQKSGDLEIAITTDHIKAIVCDVIAGGIHSSSSTVEWAMAEMMKNPRVMKKAQSEIRRVVKASKTIPERALNELTYLKLVIKETLRLHPPAPLLIPRECREACEIDGYEIPLRAKVIVNAWAIARDPKAWEDAESFFPERFSSANVSRACDFEGFNFEYIPFGAGRRMCPGISFAIAKVERALAELLYHFNWELPGKMRPEDLDMSENFGITVDKKKDLYLMAIPFTPSHEE